jgi:hypothetical protein
MRVFGVQPMKYLGGAAVFWLGAKVSVVTLRYPLAWVCALVSYGMIALALLALMRDVHDWFDGDF